MLTSYYIVILMYLFYRSFVWNHFKKKNIKNKKGLIVLTAVCDHCGNQIAKYEIEWISFKTR